MTKSKIIYKENDAHIEAGKDVTAGSSTYCNKCLLNVLENPLGYYYDRRYGGDRTKMVQEVLTVFQPAPFH